MKTISRRKKIAILSFFVILLLLSALFFWIGGRDRIAETAEESGTMDNTDYQWISHRFEKGSELSLNISASKTALGEGIYQLMIVVNQEDSADYGIVALAASLSSSTETQFFNAIVGKGGGEYGVPEVSYDGNAKIQRFRGDNYLYYSAIVTENEPASEMELTLQYRIEGKNRYFLNKFYGNTATLPIRFPEPPQESEETNPDTSGEEDEIVAISDTSIKRIDECFDDYFMLDNGVFCANISGESSWRDHTFTKGDSFGEILSSTEERDLKKIAPWAANVLPVGTKLYRTKEPGGAIVAEVDGELIPYVEIREG